MTAFGRLLRSALENRGWTQRGAAGHLGVSHGFLNLLMSGKRTPPIDQVDAWASALRLAGEQRRRFSDLAALAHLPEAVRERFEAFYDEHLQLRDDYAELLKQVRRVAER